MVGAEIKTESIEIEKTPSQELIAFLCGENQRAIKFMSQFTVDQIVYRPFRISSLAYKYLLRSNQYLEKTIFIDNQPIHLSTVEGWIEMLSVIPENMAFHPDLPKEVFPILGEKNGDSDTTPLHILNGAKIIKWVRDHNGIQGNTGYILDEGYLHLSMAERLDDPQSYQKWKLQINAYRELANSDLRSAKLEYDRIVLEEQPFDGKLTELIFHKIVAQMDGKELTAEEEQKIIKESLESRVRYARSISTLFENNRDGLVRFENNVWEMISKII